jgi:UDPglucose 6-dehydrogenase
MQNARATLGDRGAKYANSIEECLDGSELCIVATPWNEFKSLKSEDFTRTMHRPVVLDCWRIFDQAEFKQKLEYLAVGLGPSA